MYDAFGLQRRGTILEWGYSALAEYNGKTLLFDGGSDAGTLAHNAKAPGADLARVDPYAGLESDIRLRPESVEREPRRRRPRSTVFFREVSARGA
ncbi:MAG: hypothetical protein LC796_17765 [Acidobacteria bacterium]|nr:hypothetical protein [Acidobacteriota bacterium]